MFQIVNGGILTLKNYFLFKGAKFATSKCLIWHADYFELKTMEAQKTQEETDLPYNGLKNLDKGPVSKTEQSTEISAKIIGSVWWGPSRPRDQIPLCVPLSLCRSVAKSCPTLCDPMDCSTPSFTISRSLLKLMSIKSVMLSNHLILCHPLLLPLIFPSIRVFSSESALCIQYFVAKILELQLQHQPFQ